LVLFASIRIVEYIERHMEIQSATGTPRWELYRVLSEPIRLRLLALAAEEELTIGELAELLHESQPNVSRHAAPLKNAGLLSVRRQGTRTLVELAKGAAKDAVVDDALTNGREICVADGSLDRVAEVLKARDAVGREFFARPRTEPDAIKPPSELGAYMAAMSALIPFRSLAIDAGTGDGALLDVLAPLFERVIAVDRSEAQLARARARIQARGYKNVTLVHGGFDEPSLKELAAAGADAVFASRLLHHAPKPAVAVKELMSLCVPPANDHPGGALVIVDYAHHEDESMREEADLWLGFDSSELTRFASEAGLVDPVVTNIPSAWCGEEKDAHLPWQVMVARRGQNKKQQKKP